MAYKGSVTAAGTTWTSEEIGMTATGRDRNPRGEREFKTIRERKNLGVKSQGQILIITANAPNERVNKCLASRWKNT